MQKNLLNLLNLLNRFESFKYKTSVGGKADFNRNTKNIDFSIPLKHLSNFWITLDMPLTNYEVSWL